MRGAVFSMDLLLGLTLLTIILVSGFYLFQPSPLFEKHEYGQKKALSDDIFRAMSGIKVSEFSQSPTLNSLKMSGLSDDELELSVLDFVISYWASYEQEGEAIKEEIAKNVSREFMEASGIFSEGNFTLYMGDSPMTGEYSADEDSLIVSALIENTYGSGPIQGYMARASLKGIEINRSKYLYFGGFVGQGELSFKLDLPNFESLSGAALQLYSADNISVHVNGELFGNFEIDLGADEMSANIFEEDIDASHFQKGENLVEIFFESGNYSKSYIGGGFLRVDYISTEFYEEYGDEYEVYNFPSIGGFINLYDGFYVPGSLEEMSARLRYSNNLTGAWVFMNIANATLYDSNVTGEVDISFDSGEIEALMNSAGLSYADLSHTTVPLRVGMKSVNFSIESVGNADVILITDVSGSMNWRMDSNSEGVTRTCSDPNLYALSTKRISLAKCLDKDFSDIILGDAYNRVGLVSFDNSMDSSLGLTNNKISLYAEIDSYSAGGGTCICCGINEAINILSGQSEPSRNKSIVVMSDGEANQRCTNNYCQQICNWWWGGTCIWWQTVCDSDAAGKDAIDAACSAKQNHNITVHAIGFGPDIESDTLQSIADCGNGTYYASDDPETLSDIYSTIAQSIIEVGYTTQLVGVEGKVEGEGNTLYNDSYISFGGYFSLPEYNYGEFSIGVEKECINGVCEIERPEGISVIDARITAYSADYWTDLIIVEGAEGQKTAYNLSQYGLYLALGDPFVIDIPPALISEGENEISVYLGHDAEKNELLCPDCRLTYSLKVLGSVGYGEVFASAEEAMADAAQRLIDLISGLSGETVGISDIDATPSLMSNVKTLSNVVLVKLIAW
jgi:hypothetical protein